METWKLKAYMNRLRAISPEEVTRFRSLSMNEQNIEIEAHWMKSTGKSLRIWHWWNGAFTRLTLRPGKTVNLYERQRTDEGWSSREESITLNVDGTVTMDTVSDGSDCDGRLTDESSYVMDGLRHVDVEQERTAVMEKAGVVVSWAVPVPNWCPISSRRRDEYAEAAGY